MEVRFFLTSEDVWNFTRYGLSRRRAWLPLVVLLLFLLALLLILNDPNTASGASSSPFFTVLPIVLLSLLLVLAIGIVIQRSRSTLRLDPTLQGEHIITISPEGFRHRTSLTDSFISWRAVKEITADKHSIYFLLQSGQMRGHVIPRRAFAAPQHAEAFLGWARTYWAGGQIPPPVGPAGTSPTYEHWN